MCVCLNWSAIKTVSYPFPSPLSHYPLLIRIIVWTSVEFRCETFASLLRIKHAVSWPFVCSDFHSTASKAALKSSENAFFCLKTHHSDVVYWDLSVVFLLSFRSALFILSWIFCDSGLIQGVGQIIADYLVSPTFGFCFVFFPKDLFEQIWRSQGCSHVHQTLFYLHCLVLFL